MTARTSPASGVDQACYLYGIVPAGTRLPEDLAAEGVSLLRHRDVAAVVGDVRLDRPLGTRDDLLAHERVVESLAAGTTVVPLRFGTVVTTPSAVIDELLAPQHDLFVRMIGDFADRREFTVAGTYVLDTLLREVLAEEPDIMKLRAALRDLPEDAGYYERIHLGELIAQALDRKRETDTAVLTQTLAPYAVATAERLRSGEDAAADVAFLVDAARQQEFDKAVEELGARWAGRVRLRVIGPLAPYDFVPVRQDGA